MSPAGIFAVEVAESSALPARRADEEGRGSIARRGNAARGPRTAGEIGGESPGGALGQAGQAEAGEQRAEAEIAPQRVEGGVHRE